MDKCRICSNSANNSRFTVREMMFGIRDEFKYFECLNCGCVQISDIPTDLSKYYPQNYYSFGGDSAIKKYLKRKRIWYALGRDNSIVGRLLVRRYGSPPAFAWTKRLDIRLDQPILDVGSGVGHLLLEMRDVGYSNLTGIDPYIEHDVHYNNGVKVYKRTLDEVEGPYDLVMLHHSFEHMPNPHQVLAEIYRLLRPDQHAVLRIPVAGSYAWRLYGKDWVQLDAPRHLFLHTEKSIGILARKVGFEVERVDYDSTELQFWGSEQYKRDIPLHDKCSYHTNPHRSLFTREQLQAFRITAQTLNERREGDQACFYLRKFRDQ